VAFRFKCLNAIGELMKSAAVIFVTHTMPQVFRICSEVIVLDHGNITFHGRNLADGVGIYLSLFEGTEENISGSGEVQVIGLLVDGDDSKAFMGETLRIHHGSSLTLEATLRFSPGLGSVRLQFLLWNAEMLPVLDIMGKDLCGYSFDVPSSGQLKIRATVPHLDLNSGKYSLSVIASSTDLTRTLCRHDNAAYIQVDAAADSGAHVLSVARWTVVQSTLS
jgi:lipopolysaccharide transport system ATP-binding protein